MKSKEEITRRSLSLRLPPEVYAEAQILAEQRHLSLNSLVVEALTSLLKQYRELEVERGFEVLADDPDSDVEYAIHAQAEVMLCDAS